MKATLIKVGLHVVVIAFVVCPALLASLGRVVDWAGGWVSLKAEDVISSHVATGAAAVEFYNSNILKYLAR